MELFWKTSAGILICLILTLTLSKQERDLAVLLSIAACSMTAIAALQVLEPVLDFLYELYFLTSDNENMIKILLQIVGIALVAEFVSLLCTDAGNASLGKCLHLLSLAVILYLSIPVMESMLDLIHEIMEGI